MGSWHSGGRLWSAVGATIAAVLALVTLVMIVTKHSRHPDVGAPPPAPATSSSRPPATPRPSVRPRPAPRRPALAARAAIDGAVRKLAAQLPAGGVSVAAVNATTGVLYRFGATSGMRTGSVAKLLILESVLLRHEIDGSRLTEGELDLAGPMIENSDNKAEYQLYLQAGGRESLVDATARLGMRHTVPGDDDPALSTTSADDGLRMLAALLPRPTTIAGVRQQPLSSYSRSAALDLMHDVEPDQRWGVSAVADAGTPVALKNGWLSVDNDNGPGDNDNGLWLVDSVGMVTVHRQPVLLSVFTQHGPDFASGVRLAESLVRTITPAVVAE